MIAGPTASGKSALALQRARQMGGIIINADAMQVYGVLRVLTARPSEDETGDVPHRLYGQVAPAVRFSTGKWLQAVIPVAGEADERPLIFVGGTGLYFDALINGFAAVPQVPAPVMVEITAEVEGLDAAGRAALIEARDPEMARRLRAPDPQRVARALGVLRATGLSLARFQDAAQVGFLDGFEVERFVLAPDRGVLGERIANRFRTMIENGAIEEVQVLLGSGLDPTLPAMKAIGVREISGWLEGRLTREEAIERAVIATRQYAKRQRTWFRKRMAGWNWIDPG